MSVHFFESSSELHLKLHLSMFLSCQQIRLTSLVKCCALIHVLCFLKQFWMGLFCFSCLNGIVLFTFLSEISLLAWGSGSDLLSQCCILLPWWICSPVLVVDVWAPLGCRLYIITPPEYHECPTSFLPILTAFHYCFLSDCCVGLPVPCWIEVMPVGLFVLPDFSWKAISLSPLSIMFAVGWSCVAFFMLSYVPSISTLGRVFMMNGVNCKWNAFPGSVEMILSWFWSFPFFDVLDHIH